MVKPLSAIILERLISGELSTKYEEEEHKRYFQDLKSYHFLMTESATIYRDQHARLSSVLVRIERKIKTTIAFTRSREGSSGLDLVNSVEPKIEDLIRNIKLSLEGIDVESINDMTQAHTWAKFSHQSGAPLFNSRDSVQATIRKLAQIPLTRPNLVNLYVGKVKGLVSECLRLDDLIQLSEDARFESYRMIRYVQSDLQKLLDKTCHFSRKHFQCARCCVTRELRKILRLVSDNRPHWVSPESRQSLRYCNPQVYYS